MGDLLKQIKTNTNNGNDNRKSYLKKALESLDDKDAADLQEAVNDLSIPASVISRVMRERGVHIPAATIQAYRRGEHKQ